MPPARSVLLVVVASCLGLGCAGAIEESPPPPEASPSPGGEGERHRPAPTSPDTVPPPVRVSPAPPVAAPAPPLRRLTRREYAQTIRDLLGVTGPPDSLPRDDNHNGFSNDADLAQVSPLLVERYQSNAEQLAAAAVRNLARLVPCAPERDGEEPCARIFVERFGLRAFRRPLSAAETGRLLELFRTNRAGADFAGGIQAVLQAMLQSPHFLYLVEPPPARAGAGGLAPLGPYEVASRLSYFLWGTMPDQPLLEAARTGTLATAAQVSQQARRMLQDPRAREALGVFFSEWLDLPLLDQITRSKTRFPEFGETLRKAMRDETLGFLRHLAFEGDGRLETLLTAAHTFANEPLARVYGVLGVTGSEMRRIELDPAVRAGVLTHPAVLAITAHSSQTSPTLRGQFVRKRLMCQQPPPPPGDVDTSLPPARPGQSLRQQLAAHVANPACAGCHQLIDPIGLGFERYDPIGRYRTELDGAPVEDDGQVRGSQDADGAFRGVPELARRLAGSAQVSDCVARQWFRYALGRGDTDGDAPALAQIGAAFGRSGHDLRALVLALVESEPFRLRPVEVSR